MKVKSWAMTSVNLNVHAKSHNGYTTIQKKIGPQAKMLKP